MAKKLQVCGSLGGGKGTVKSVNGVSPDKDGNVDISITDEETLELLIQEDMLPVVTDSDGAILADENNDIILW